LKSNEIIPHNSLIAEMDEKSFNRLLGILPTEEISLVREPHTGLIMMTANDCFDTDFCIGEALVTVAEAKIGRVNGFAMILGDNPNRAIVSASVDAIMSGHDEELKSKVQRCLRGYERRARRHQKHEALLLSSTMVSFENMREG